MDSDEESQLSHAERRQYSALRSDLSAALAAFDRAQDWADLIHDLQRVNRVLSKHSGSSFLPEKSLLAKRLAQCLTSFLPSGVHLKALETYHIVFKRIGSERLARDLPLYAGGLFPLFSHCSTSLKAPLLSLYETHFLTLGTALCPVLDGFVLAILPGVEDESSEFYTRSLKLLDNIGKTVGNVGVFARSLWRALLLSPPMRLSAAHYLRSKLAADHDDLHTEMVSDMPLVAYAITGALADSNTLTQRSVLDLLLGELALDSAFFQSRGSEERDAAVAVVRGVFGTLIRRDMSLTKRVHAWLLGGKDSVEGIAFCRKYSNDLVLAAMDQEFAALLSTLDEKDTSFATRPCRITAALMSRAELSRCLGHHFALRILRYGRSVILKMGPEHVSDIRYAISDLLQDLGSDKVFAELERMLAEEDEKKHEDFELLTFALSLFPTKDEVVKTEYLPALLRVAVQSLNAVTTDSLTLDRAVAFCSKAIKNMGLTERGALQTSFIENLTAAVSSFASFFVAWLAHVVETAPVEVRRAYSDVSAGEEHAAEVRMASVHEAREECISLAKGACSFFVTAAASGVGGAEMLRSALQATAKCASAADVRIALSGTTAFADISSYAAPQLHGGDGSNEQILGVVRRSWRQMHPSLRTATPQSAQAFLSLQRAFPEETKIVIADGILSSDPARRLRNLERFACLWRLAVEHSLRPLPADDGLFLMLDALTDEDWAPKMLARSWLSYAVEVDAPSVLDAPLRLLLTSEAKTNGPRHEFAAVYDAPRALYGFQALRGILESCTSIVSSNREQGYGLHAPAQVSRRHGKRGRTGIRALASASVSSKTAHALSSVFGLDIRENSALESSSDGVPTPEGPVRLSHMLPVHNYVITIALTCLGYLRGRVPSRLSVLATRSDMDELKVGEAATSITFSAGVNGDYEWLAAGLGSKSLSDLHAGVCAASAECLATLFRAVPVPTQMSASLSHTLGEPILTLLSSSSDRADPVLQLHFLNTVTFLITAEGPCYLSSVQGKDAFVKTDPSRIRLSYSESQNQLQLQRITDKQEGLAQVGSVEGLTNFVPWLLDGVAWSCRPMSSESDNGSHEVLGIRRRWVQFIETVMRHIGVSLPVLTEGLIGVLTELLSSQLATERNDSLAPESDYSRGDEILVLLEAIAVVSSNVLWSFEFALARGELKDNAMSNFPMDSGSASTHFANQNSNEAAVTTAGDNQIGNATPEDGSKTALGSSMNGSITGSSSVQSEQTSNVSAATSAMMNAINPLRMINDFVKDVLGGGGSDGLHTFLDPRRSAARLLYNYLPGILKNLTKVWGSMLEAQSQDSAADARQSLNQRNGPPRLSMEIPRERRESQRAAVLSIVEPIFEIRPRDVIASLIAIVCEEQSEFGELEEEPRKLTASRISCDMLHALEETTPELTFGAVKSIFNKAEKWSMSSTEAKEGRSQAAHRRKALSALTSLIESGLADIRHDSLKTVGRISTIENTSSLPGGTSGIELVQGVFPGASLSQSHEELFHWGDFFAAYGSEQVETACLNFVDMYIKTLPEGSNVQNSFPALHALLKDALSTGKKKRTIPAALRALGTFVSRNPSPFPDRRQRREIMTLAASGMSSCSTIAANPVDISAEQQNGSMKNVKSHLSVVALRALALTVPSLIDSSFLDEKPQLSSSVTTCLAPAAATLKKSAARACSLQTVAGNPKRARGTTTEQTEKQRKETFLHIKASKAAADVLLQISSRDWGVKFARRELLTLIEDSNFFFAKGDGVLEKISAVIREVVAGGGAASLLASIGSSSSAGTPGIPSIFTGRDSEAVLRGRAIRRIAFCVFVAEPDFYSPQLPSVLERLRDALRMGDTGLVVECLLCLRALLLRIGPSSVSAFRATTLSELFRIMSSPRDDLNATIAALKFLDIVTLLSPADYGYERCFFFGETSQCKPGPDNPQKVFEPFAPRLTTLWKGSSKIVDDVFKPPLRLQRGLTVLPGKPPKSFDEEFIGRYAAALMTRNSMPKMKATEGDMETIRKEFELEFLT